MLYPMIAGRLFNRAHVVQSEYARAVAAVVAPRMGLKVDGETEEKEKTRRSPYAPTLCEKSGIMTLPVVGGLYHRGDELDAMSGAQSYTNLNNSLLAAMANPKVKGVLLDVDSPGGEVAGCFSFADSIKAASAKYEKPIWGIANALAASGGYVIGCACERLYAARDARVGSIGVVWLHLDYSQQIAEQGIVATFVKAGDRKVDGNMFEPLSEIAKAEIQAGVDKVYAMFVAHVAANTGLSDDAIRATEARCYLGHDAAELGMVQDVSSFQETHDMMADELKGSGKSKHVVHYFTPEGRVIDNE